MNASVNAISPYGSANVFTVNENFSASMNGILEYSVQLFDAFSATKLTLASTNVNHTAGESPSFGVYANQTSGNRILFIDDTAIGNDTFYGNLSNSNSYSDNIITTVSGNITAGSDEVLAVAYTDLYGNLATNYNATGNIQLTAGTPAPGNSGNGSVPVYGTAALTNSTSSISVTLYDSTGSSQIGISATSAGNTVNLNTTSLLSIVDEGSEYGIAFMTSTGDNTITDATSLTDDGSRPVSLGVANSALDDVYVGVIDQYGNLVSNPANGTITITGNATTNSTTLQNSVTVNISGNTDSNGLIYFDPSDDNLKLIITSPSSGCVMLDALHSGGLTSGNVSSNEFVLGNSTPPSVSVTYPNGGESFYPGDVNVGWTVVDTDLGTNSSSNTVVSISLDGGVTWSENIATLPNDTYNFSWTVSENHITDMGLIRVQVTDDSGNLGEDVSNGTFSVSPSTSVIDYVVGDVNDPQVTVNFREPVYSDTGSTLISSDLVYSTGLNVSSFTHELGARTASVTFQSNLTSANITASNIGAKSGEVSKNSSGANPYTSGIAIASVNIRQLHVEELGVNYTTATSNLNLFGLRLVGWDDNGASYGDSRLLSKINVTIQERKMEPLILVILLFLLITQKILVLVYSMVVETH